MPSETTQNIIGYRAGALASELQLTGEMKPYFDRALAAGVHHNRIRELDLELHNNVAEFQSALGNEIKKIKGIS